MNSEEKILAPKKARRPGTRWLRFYQLNRKEAFFIGNRQGEKKGFCWAVMTPKHTCNFWMANWRPICWVAPWQKVRSRRPVKKAVIPILYQRPVTDSPLPPQYIPDTAENGQQVDPAYEGAQNNAPPAES